MTGTLAAIGIVGCGTMGRGIAQLALQNGHVVYAFDGLQAARESLAGQVRETYEKLIEKAKRTTAERDRALANLRVIDKLADLAPCELIIEAVSEDLAAKKNVFEWLGKLCPNSILATNTSSLSVTAIAASAAKPKQVVGLHFFNPAPIMKLVEIVPALQTDAGVVSHVQQLVKHWHKRFVVVKDTPGFLVNRVARPFYGEALRILEEGLATVATIDYAMRSLFGFPMGPFELMDLIGLDINYAVTQSVFEGLHYDPRYRPSITQRRMVEAGYLGRKTGRGFYEYDASGRRNPVEPTINAPLCTMVGNRILAMLINEAVEATYLGLATEEDIDDAVTLGLNYPKGLLRWADELGIDQLLEILEGLHHQYGDDRYRPSILMRLKAARQEKFYE